MSYRAKIVSQKTLKKKITGLRKQKKTVAFTNGCFDILHLGHVLYLQRAKKNRILIVGLNSDRSVRKIKGPRRPILPEKARAALLASLECVDYVTLFNEETPAKLIAALKPDVLIKGADWKGKEVAGSESVRKVEYIKYIDGCSTSHIIKKIIDAYHQK